jgi:hypothetical protein
MGELVTRVVLGVIIFNTVVPELLWQSRFAKKRALRSCTDEEKLKSETATSVPVACIILNQRSSKMGISMNDVRGVCDLQN